MASCDECKWCLLEDFGYSNYTVEGTYVHCLKNIHPESGFDRWYGADERLKFAETCESFVAGEPTEVDCDREALESYSDKLSTKYADDPEVVALLDAWELRQY